MGSIVVFLVGYVDLGLFQELDNPVRLHVTQPHKHPVTRHLAPRIQLLGTAESILPQAIKRILRKI